MFMVVLNYKLPMKMKTFFVLRIDKEAFSTLALRAKPTVRTSKLGWLAYNVVCCCCCFILTQFDPLWLCRSQDF